MSGVEAEHFADLLLAGTRFIDVRAEVEFAKGCIPGAVNLPILDNAEREQVGTCYKRRGQEAAIELGHTLVGGALKEARVAAWCEIATREPGAHVYCWRGGLRSRTAVQWMAEAGYPVPVIAGGYKALRQRLIDELAPAGPEESWFVIGGRTGSAKTALLNELPGGIDLEGFARHRGSSFGRRAGAAPVQVDFENALALALLRRRHEEPAGCLFFEDESRQIGSLSVPLEVFRRMREAPLVILEVPMAQRVGKILDDYIRVDLAEHLALDAEAGFEHFARQLTESLQRIRRRLGEERYQFADGCMQAAIAAHRSDDDAEGHRDWIELLLRDYYDPMYDYQLAKSTERVVFRGGPDALREWALSVALSGPA